MQQSAYRAARIALVFCALVAGGHAGRVAAQGTTDLYLEVLVEGVPSG